MEQQQRPPGIEFLEEKQAILELMISKVMKQPYEGSFQFSREMPVLLAGVDEDRIAGHYAECLANACAEAGALVDAQPVVPHGCAPYETMAIGAQMGLSGNADQAQQMIEASAELLRLLLWGAVISATADLDGDDDNVIVRCNRDPEFVVGRSLDPAAIGVLGGFFGHVVRQKAPEVSYLLGSTFGQKARGFKWHMPLPAFTSGPNRIRWLDNRSVGHVETEQIMRAPQVLH